MTPKQVWLSSVTASVALILLPLVAIPYPASATPSARCHNKDVTIIGTDDDDTVTGTDGPDVISTGRGDDTIYGMGGADVICAGAGTDRLSGGSGDDILVGGFGADFERGGPGNDLIRAMAGYDTWAGDDEHGNTGDDRLVGGTGSEHFWPGPGDDTVDGGKVLPHSGGDSDIVDYSRAMHGVHVYLEPGVARGQGRDALRSIEQVVGSPYDDVIVGRPVSDVLEGGDTTVAGSRGLGNDIIRGRGGRDIVLDGTCFSSLVCPSVKDPGKDRLFGGRDDDFLGGIFGYDIVSGGAGHDRCDGAEQKRGCEAT